jgi:hypothetical protein
VAVAAALRYRRTVEIRPLLQLPSAPADEEIRDVRAHTSLVIATTIPISTNTTIAICSQIHVGDMS